MGTARYYTQTFGSELRSSQPNAPSGVHGWPYLVVAVALISGLTVFISLCERDNSRLLAVNGNAHTIAVQSPAAPQSTPLPAPSGTGSDAVTRVTVPTQIAQSEAAAPPVSPATETERPGLLQFTLSRSRRFQQVGPISVGVWKVDTRRKLYDVSLLANGHRVDRKKVSLNASISLPSSDPSHPFLFTATSMTRNALTGNLNAPATTTH